MRSLGAIGLAAALAGCNGDGDSDTDVATGDGCPEGLQRSISSQNGMVFTQMTLNGADWFPGLNNTATYAGQPAVCRNSEGTRAVWIFEQANTVFGSLDVSATSTGSVALNLTDLTLNLFGSPEGAVFVGPDAWQQGVMQVDSVGGTFQVGVTNATGISPAGDQVIFTLSARAASF